jgi:hypothetical protein
MDSVYKTLCHAAFFIFTSAIIVSKTALADAIADPCAGKYALINLVDRPSHSDSACVVPLKHAVLETGYAYSYLKGGVRAQDYPEAELRIGLPLKNEFAIFLPDYIKQTITPHSGYTASAVRIKHEIGYNAHWLGTVEALLALPTGGGAFGSNKYNPTINGILNYTINSTLAVLFQLGVGSFSLPALQGGQRYTSINPDLIFSWQVLNQMQLYAEWYGQSRTSPYRGAGSNMDAGILYLPATWIEVDAEIGHRISGNLDGLNQYYGVGMSLLF